MARRKITEEAEQTTTDQETSSSDENERREERMQTTWRADNDLIEELDEFANRYGMSRNAAITMLVRQGLEE